MGEAHLRPAGDPGPADGFPLPRPLPEPRALEGTSSRPCPSSSCASPVSIAHPDCAAAGTMSPSISTSASSAAMIGPDPSRPPERSRERWRAWRRGHVRHRAESTPRPAPSRLGKWSFREKMLRSSGVRSFWLLLKSSSVLKNLVAIGRFDPYIGSSGVGNGNPLQYSCWEIP